MKARTCQFRVFHCLHHIFRLKTLLDAAKWIEDVIPLSFWICPLAWEFSTWMKFSTLQDLRLPDVIYLRDASFQVEALTINLRPAVSIEKQMPANWLTDIVVLENILIKWLALETNLEMSMYRSLLPRACSKMWRYSRISSGWITPGPDSSNARKSEIRSRQC
jgi:hypothetical protein